MITPEILHITNWLDCLGWSSCLLVSPVTFPTYTQSKIKSGKHSFSFFFSLDLSISYVVTLPHIFQISIILKPLYMWTLTSLSMNIFNNNRQCYLPSECTFALYTQYAEYLFFPYFPIIHKVGLIPAYYHSPRTSIMPGT
jgi:hypothetical protein